MMLLHCRVVNRTASELCFSLNFEVCNSVFAKASSFKSEFNYKGVSLISFGAIVFFRVEFGNTVCYSCV
jgi:hypothetical protein